MSSGSRLYLLVPKIDLYCTKRKGVSKIAEVDAHEPAYTTDEQRVPDAFVGAKNRIVLYKKGKI